MKELKKLIHLKAKERGQTNLAWLRSYHSFSFGQYVKKEATGFGDLLVINDDTVSPGGGFPTHGHRDMEIITYVVSGSLAHEDSLGNRSLIKQGQIQFMSAGKGILHSEFNPSNVEQTRFLQIWIRPGQSCLTPSYKTTTVDQTSGKISLISSQNIQQDAKIYYGNLEKSLENRLSLIPDRRYWLQVINGNISINDNLELSEGDGLGIISTNDQFLSFSSKDKGDFLLFELR